MKCEDVQFIYLADPQEADAEARLHLNECPDCRAVVASEEAFQSSLDAAIRLSVPEDLDARLNEISSQNSGEGDTPSASADRVVTLNVKRKTSTWVGFAVAASLLLGVGILNISPFRTPDIAGSSVGQLVYQDILHHGGLALVNHSLQPGDVDRQMRKFGFQLHVPGQISYVKRCPIGDTYGLHLVYQSESGPVTFIYMPDLQISGPQGFNYDGMQGVIRPAPKGSMAVIGDGHLNIEQTEVEINKGIEWL